jgi:hypothetical protein
MSPAFHHRCPQVTTTDDMVRELQYHHLLLQLQIIMILMMEVSTEHLLPSINPAMIFL